MESSHAKPITLSSYLIAYFLCLVLTFISYYIIVEHVMTGAPLFLTMGALILIQAALQLIFFLHIAREGKPRWQLFTCLFMGMVVFIVVGGSLWIMYHLNYNVMPMHGELMSS